ncbi:MAG TPA: PDZ domain-containing protein [Gemmatimonadaceae bacterium]|nr:PDZ domain-containing protein [Gemmatimonadaceae bacterium]
MSRSPAPLLVSVGLALAASASPLVAQKSEAIARGAAKVSASDSSGIRLRRLERTIDSLVQIFDDEVSPERRLKLRQQIDERFAEFTAVRTATSPKKAERSVYLRRAPEATFESRFGEGFAMPPQIPQGALPGWIGIVVSGAPTQIRVENKEIFMRYLLYPQIVSVDPTSPAQRAGLAPGDTLMAYNGRDVRADEISMTKLLVPKATVKVRVRRDGKMKDLPVVVAEAPARIRERRLDEMRYVGSTWEAIPSTPPVAPGVMTPPPPRGYFPPARLGVGSTPVVAPLPPVFTLSGVAGAQVVTLSESMKRKLGLPSGVLVTAVPFGSPAAQSGLEEGDVIVRVGQEAVATERDLRALVRRAAVEGEHSVKLELRRGKERRTLELRWRSN